MAVRFIDSFDHYGYLDVLLKWDGLYQTNLSGVAIPSSTYLAIGSGRNSTNGLTLKNNSGGVFLRKSVDNQSSWIVGVAVYMSALPTTTQPIIIFTDGNSYQTELTISSSGFLGLSVNNVVKTTGTTALSANTWYFLEITTSHSASVAANACTARLNGVLEVTMPTATNTKPSGNAYSNGIILHAPPNVTVTFDDFYACDTSGSVNNAFLGDMRIECLFVANTGTNTNWTPNAGSNYAAVDEPAQDGDTTYVSTSTVTTKDTYLMGTLSSSPITIAAIQTVMIARKDDAGSRGIAPVIRSAGTDYTGTTVTIGDTYSCFLEVRELDPGTSSAWTYTTINAMEAGVKLVS